MSSVVKINEVEIEKNTLGKNLVRLLQKNNISESALAKTLEVPYNTIHRLVTGEITDPKLSTLSLISSYFKISIDSLLNEKCNHFKNQELGYSVPIFEWKDLEDSTFQKKFNSNHWTKWEAIPPSSTEEVSPSAFAVKSLKNMQPRFPYGTSFIIDPNLEMQDSDLVLVRIKKSNNVVLKEVKMDNSCYFLDTLNDDIPPLTFNTRLHSVLGVVFLTLLHTRA